MALFVLAIIAAIVFYLAFQKGIIKSVAAGAATDWEEVNISLVEFKHECKTYPKHSLKRFHRKKGGNN
ncbi:MAG: hypothetical protein HUJ51_00115 [Eggerthellaceae bacterium]|nr:hypothetical protein [Eggerthellaceae bacterium]